jgi:hypothetical protein
MEWDWTYFALIRTQRHLAMGLASSLRTGLPVVAAFWFGCDHRIVPCRWSPRDAFKGLVLAQLSIHTSNTLRPGTT